MLLYYIQTVYVSIQLGKHLKLLKSQYGFRSIWRVDVSIKIKSIIILNCLMKQIWTYFIAMAIKDNYWLKSQVLFFIHSMIFIEHLLHAK